MSGVSLNVAVAGVPLPLQSALAETVTLWVSVEGFAYPFIGIDLQPIVGTSHVTDRNTRVEVAARSLQAQCFLRYRSIIASSRSSRSRRRQ